MFEYKAFRLTLSNLAPWPLEYAVLLVPLRSVQFRPMLVGVWLGLLWVLFYFFDHYIQSSDLN